MKAVLVAVLAASMLTAVTGSITSADAATPCAVATTNRALDTWLPGAVSRPAAVTYSRFTTTSTDWTLIKLGNLKADLQLKLYDGACRLISTSQHAGTDFEQIYRSLPAGRYYLGVSGVAGATSSYDIRFAPLRDGLHALSAHAYITSYRSDLLEVDGEVLNNRSSATFFRYVTVTFYSRAGHVVARTEATFSRRYVRARSRSSFIAQVIKPSQPWSRFTVVTTTQALNGFPPPPLVTIVAAKATRDSQGNLHYPGRITNNSAKPIFLGSVAATLYNTYGNVDYVNYGVITPDRLAPRKAGSFDVVFDKPTGVNAAALTLAS
jgi:hypothetical protein